MSSAFKAIKSVFGFGDDRQPEQQRHTSSVLALPAADTKSKTLPSIQKAKPIPIADDKKTKIEERKRAQKIYGGRGREGSVLGSKDGGDTYG